MKTPQLPSPRDLFALAVACIVSAAACDANHVLGVADGGPSQSPGTAGATGNGPGSGMAGSTTAGTGGAASMGLTSAESTACNASGGNEINFASTSDAQSRLVGVWALCQGTGITQATEQKNQAGIELDADMTWHLMSRVNGALVRAGGFQASGTYTFPQPQDLNFGASMKVDLFFGLDYSFYEATILDSPRKMAWSATGTSSSSPATVYALEPGGTAGASGAAGSAGTTPGTGGVAAVKADPATLGPAQSWTGYIENHMFHSGSDALALTFATDANGVVKGTMVFGMGTPPPPATDPNVGYPPDFVSMLLYPAIVTAPVYYVSEGTVYSFDGGSLDAQRLRFTVDLKQLWAGWCALQTPPANGTGQCVPSWAYAASPGACGLLNPQTMEEVPADCGKVALCDGTLSPCACTATSCGLANTSHELAVFDVLITGSSASGTADLLALGTPGVHFVKN